MATTDPQSVLHLDALDERRLRLLIEVGPSLGADLQLDSVLDRLLTVAREVTGARYAAVGVLDRSRHELERFVTQGIDDATRQTIGDLPKGHGVLGVLIREPKPLRLHDVSDHVMSYGFPPGHPQMRSFLGVPVKVGGEAWGNLYLTDKEGGDFEEADEQAVVLLAQWAGLVIGQARLHEETEAQRDELAYTVRALEATTIISRALGTEVELEPTLELVVKRGRALADARSMLILLVEGGDLVITAMAGEASADLKGARLPIEGSASGRAFQTGQTQSVRDFATQIAMTSRRAGLGLSGEQFVGPGVHPALFIPMIYRGQPVGVLNTIGRLSGKEQFNLAEQELITTFAASAATAVATAQSVQSDRLSRSLRAMEEERSHWARELHDETLQGLGALRVLLSSARRAKDAEALDKALQQAVDQVTGEVQNLRALITDLRPAALDEIGLQPALEGLIDQRRGQMSLDITSRIDLRFESGDEPDRLALDIETAVYRLVQEALTNAAKHAQAGRVAVTVIEDERRVTVTVEDDGIGFDPDGDSAGFGITGMRERVGLAKGEMSIESEPGKGTSIRATLPVIRASSQPHVRLATETRTG
jgi:signal transduction histidine kinase